MLSQVGSALQSGNLTAASQALTGFQQQAASAAGKQHHHHHGGGTGTATANTATTNTTANSASTTQAGIASAIGSVVDLSA